MSKLYLLVNVDGLTLDASAACDWNLLFINGRMLLNDLENISMGIYVYLVESGVMNILKGYDFSINSVIKNSLFFIGREKE